MPNHDALEMTRRTRQALRRIRGAAISGKISAVQMQEHAEELLHAFAIALLTSERPKLLKESDRNNVSTNITNLNKYLSELLRDEQPVNLVGNPISEESVGFMLNALTSERSLKKFGYPESHVVALLSTGALNLALLSYLYDMKVHFAAVNRERDAAIAPEIPKDKQVVVIDDVLGNQARTVMRELETRGHKTTQMNLFGGST